MLLLKHVAIHLNLLFDNYRQLNKKKEFTSGAVFKPLQAEVVGQMTLGDYQDVVSNDRQVEELRLVGLTDDEIQLKLSHGNDSSNTTVGDDFINIHLYTLYHFLFLFGVFHFHCHNGCSYCITGNYDPLSSFYFTQRTACFKFLK